MSQPRTMKRFGMAAAVLSAAGLAGSAAAQPGEVHYIPAAKLAAMTAKIENGLASVAVPTGSNAVVLIEARDKDGEPEIHDKIGHEIIARRGAASILVGGKVEGDHLKVPNEHRGGKIVGGAVYKLAPGDVIWVPAGTPHQMLIPKGKRFTYMTVKYPGP